MSLTGAVLRCMPQKCKRFYRFGGLDTAIDYNMEPVVNSEERGEFSISPMPDN